MTTPTQKPPRTLAEIIATQRKSLGLSQEELAELAKVSWRTVQDIERGQNLTPRKDTVLRIIAPLKLTADEILEIEFALAGATQTKRVKISSGAQASSVEIERNKNRGFEQTDIIQRVPVSVEPGIESKSRAKPFAIAGVSITTLVLIVFTGWLLQIGHANETASPTLTMPPSQQVANLPTNLPTQPTRQIEPMITLAATAIPALSATASGEGISSFCGGLAADVKEIPFDDTTQFLRQQGVAYFDAEHVSGGILYNYIRAVALDKFGIWIGYHSPGENETVDVGLSHYDAGVKWTTCNRDLIAANKDINDIAVDQTGKVFVATDNAGVLMWDGQVWRAFTADTVSAFTTNQFFKITIDSDNVVWVGSAEGVARYDGVSWTVPYSLHTKEQTLFNNRVHVVAWSESGDLWVGHVANGISLYRNIQQKWEWLTPRTSSVSGDRVRDILVQKQNSTTEAVWIATADGGITMIQGEGFVVYNDTNGLPSNDVRDLAIDRYNRVWAATAEGTVYRDGDTWNLYNTLDTLSIAFSPVDCSKPSCAFDNDHIWTGTAIGLTHTRIPFVDDALEVITVCFTRVRTQEETCVTPTEEQGHNRVTASYPDKVQPGESLLFAITVKVLNNHTLSEAHNDFLSNIDDGGEYIWGAYQRRKVQGEIVAGQEFTFAAPDNGFIAPEISADVTEKTFVSDWRVWMWTRYTGPTIRIEFTVRN